MVFQGLSKDQAAAAFKPLIDFANANGADYEGQNSLVALAEPARYFWNGWVLRFFAPSVVNFDGRPGAWTDFWWSGTSDEVGAFWHAYTSVWMPAALLEPQNQSRLIDAWFAASRHWWVSLHFNKGLAGATEAAIAAARTTAMNPRCNGLRSRYHSGRRRLHLHGRLTRLQTYVLARSGCRPL